MSSLYAEELYLKTSESPTTEAQVGKLTTATSTRVLYMGDQLRNKPISPIGFAPVAVPWGYSASDAHATTIVNLVAVTAGLSQAIFIPVPIIAPMLGRAISIWNTDAASARSAETRLYFSPLNNNDWVQQIPGTDATWSFTPAGAQTRTSSNFSGAPVLLPPGVVWVVIRNTSTTQTFGIGGDTATDVAGARYFLLGSQAALTTTMDFTSAGGVSSNIPVCSIRGYMVNGTSSW